MSKDIAIKVENLSKTFRIPHEKISTIRGAFVNAFRNKGFEEFKALDDVSFEVKKGEFFGIIGRNGSGKSTLLKILAGIYQPDAGKVKVNGLISPFLELGIGFNPELSGRDNIYLNAAVLGLSHKQISERFDDIVDFSELRRFIDQKVKNYSSGMQVRLAFSVAIHANRDILLMDEVLAVGDTNFQSKCLEEFNKYRDLGKTVILVTHDIPTVQRYCDRAMLLRNGKIEMIGDSDEVGDKYIYQNMSDEERRIFEEEKRREEKAKKDTKQLAREQKNIEERAKVEEEKNQREEKESPEEEKRNKVAEITTVEFFDKDGSKKNVFKDDEKIIIRISYKIKENQTVKTPCFGIAIHNDIDIHLFGTYTKNDNFKINPLMSDGHIDFVIKGDSFPSGVYYVTTAIYNENNDKIPIDRKIKNSKFKIVSNQSNYGLIKINHQWIQ